MSNIFDGIEELLLCVPRRNNRQTRSPSRKIRKNCKKKIERISNFSKVSYQVITASPSQLTINRLHHQKGITDDTLKKIKTEITLTNLHKQDYRILKIRNVMQAIPTYLEDLTHHRVVEVKKNTYIPKKVTKTEFDTKPTN